MCSFYWTHYLWLNTEGCLKYILAAWVLPTNDEDYDHMVHLDCMWKQY